MLYPSLKISDLANAWETSFDFLEKVRGKGQQGTWEVPLLDYV